MNRLFVYIKSYFVSYPLTPIAVIRGRRLYIGYYKVGETDVVVSNLFDSYEEAWATQFIQHYKFGKIRRIKIKF